jgi:hypothetical protein
MSVDRRLRAPQQDAAIFAQPTLEQMRATLNEATWEQSLAPPDARLAGRSLRDLRRLGRETALQAAQAYLNSAQQPLVYNADSHILAAGHQPEIFHPGVWIKNFALNGLARAAGMAPLNLVVDNDTIKSSALALPHWQSASVPRSYHIAKVAFDAWPGEVPAEEGHVHDEEAFASFPQRVHEITRSWGFTPLVDDYWAKVMEHRSRTANVGERLVAGRRAVERQWGCHNLELPVSRLCETEPFAWFIAHLFQGLEPFHSAYNDIVRTYRRVHRLRSRNHPVPDLASDGDWRELPLWAWRTGALRRGRLFVRQRPDSFELRVEKESWPALPRESQPLVAALQSLHQQGFKIRSRALTTTLFTRLVIADGFIHGIGGGIYDELTDELLRRFFAVQPPPFLVLSGTLLLPLPAFPATLAQRRLLAHELRDLHWNPQRHLTPPIAPTAATLVKRKQELLTNGPITWEMNHEFKQITEALTPFVNTLRTENQATLTRLDDELHANAILRRRDYGFCLYPQAQLQPFCLQFLE